jgi:hypothetical protein
MVINKYEFISQEDDTQLIVEIDDMGGDVRIFKSKNNKKKGLILKAHINRFREIVCEHDKILKIHKQDAEDKN